MADAVPYHHNPSEHHAPVHRSHPGRKIAMLAVALGLASAAGWGPLLQHRINGMSARQDCLNYVPPADQVVFAEDPAQIDSLSTKPGYERTVGGRLRWVPACWRAEMPTLNTSGTVFLHQLTSPGGHKRLVSLDVIVGAGMYLSSTGSIEDVSLSSTVIDPKTGLSSDKPVKINQTALWVCPVDPKPTTFFGGTVDPKDPSKFSFDYQRNGIRSTIDGQLGDDDTITLTPRRGILTHDRDPFLWEPDTTPGTPTANPPPSVAAQ
jgi:hypothetical protein